MSDLDDKLRSAYSTLPRAEPPAALDAAILDASRRALARPRAAQRWAVPVSIAAVLVLAFGISLHREEEPPMDEAPVKMAAPEAARSSPDASAPALAPAKPAAKERMLAQAPARKTARAEALRDEPVREEPRAPKLERKDTAPPQGALERETANVAPAAEAPAQPMAAAPVQRAAPATSAATVAPAAPAAPAATFAAPAPTGAASEPRMQARMKSDAARGIAAEAQAPVDELTRELDAIAKLRAGNRDDEADKALEAFRRKHPGYRIPDATWERVRPR